MVLPAMNLYSLVLELIGFLLGLGLGVLGLRVCGQGLTIEIQILKTSPSIPSDHSGSALTIKVSDTRTCSYNLEPDPDDPI